MYLFSFEGMERVKSRNQIKHFRSTTLSVPSANPAVYLGSGLSKNMPVVICKTSVLLSIFPYLTVVVSFIHHEVHGDWLTHIFIIQPHQYL